MRGARSGTRLTGGTFPGLVVREGLVEGPEVYPPQEVADLARLLPRGVEPVLCARVDLHQKLDGLAQGPDQLLVGHLVQRVGELLELTDHCLKAPQIFLFSPTVLHKWRTIHHPGHAFAPPKTHALPDRPRRPGSGRRRSPRPPAGRPRTAG